MKRILKGHTVWRAKCPICDCEFEYDNEEIFKVYERREIFKLVQCPYCKTSLNHSDSTSTTTEMNIYDTMTT